MVRSAMFQALSQNYQKIIKKMPYQFGAKSWKAALHLTLLVCWAIIIAGTFSLFK